MAKENKTNSQIGSGIILSYVYIAISMIAGLLYTPRMLAMMGQNEYGLYGLGSSVISYLSFLGLGLESALVKYTARYVAAGDKENENRLGGMYLVMYSIIAVVALVTGFVVSNYAYVLSATLSGEEVNKLKTIIRILTVNLAISFPMSIFGAAITAHEKFSFRKIVSIVREITMPVVVLLALHYGYRSIGLVVIHTVFNIIVLLLDFAYATGILKYRPRYSGFDWKLIKEIFSYTLFVFIGNIVDRISNSTNSMVLAATAGTAAVAVFNIGAQLYGYFLNFAASIASFFFPRIVGMTYKNASNKELSELFIKVGRIQLYVVLLICSGFVVFGKEFIFLWAGEDYAMAYWIAVICMVPTVINRSQSLGPQILLAKNKHQFRAIMLVFITILDVAISIPLAKRYQGVGAAIGTAVATILGPILIMNVYYAKKIGLDISAYWKSALPIILKVVMFSLAGSLLNVIMSNYSWVTLLVKIAIFLIGYIVIIYFLCFNPYEKELASRIFGKIRFGRN